MQGQDPEITIEVIDRFLEARGWRKSGDYCWLDSERKFTGAIHWTTALEVQFRRDNKASAAEMTRNLGALASVGASH